MSMYKHRGQHPRQNHEYLLIHAIATLRELRKDAIIPISKFAMRSCAFIYMPILGMNNWGSSSGAPNPTFTPTCLSRYTVALPARSHSTRTSFIIARYLQSDQKQATDSWGRLLLGRV